MYSSEDGVLFDKDKTEIIRYPEGKKDTSYTIPNSVTSIVDYAFYHCTSLTNITIPDSVTRIWSFAFDGCSSLTSITIPNSVTSIGRYVFDGCKKLTSITIPDSVTSIGGETFRYCNSLKKVLCFGNNVTLGNEAFSNCPSDMKIYVKNGLEGYDKNGWEKYSDNIVRYNEALKQPTITFKSRNQTEKVELADDIFKSLVTISSYSVGNSGVVSVDGYLNEKPKKNGTTFVNINVKYKDGPKVTLKQNVVVDVKSTGVKLSDSDITFTDKNNLTKKLTSTVLPQDSAFQDVTWKSSDTNIATVDNEGNVTAKGRGTCKITATTTDGTNLSASCSITSNITYIRGDITRDGKVDMEDVYTAMKRLARGTLSDEDKVIVEVTNDGRVDMEDIYKMLKYIARKITVL